MAFFQFPWLGRTPPDEKASRRGRASPVESVEVMRRRARHRLIGAAVLIGVGVVGFPVLFDTQPRPIPVDIPIDIPDRQKVAPLAVPSAVASAAQQPSPAGSAVSQLKAPPHSPVQAAGTLDGEEVVHSKPAAKQPVAAASLPAAGAQSKDSTKPAAPAAPTEPVKPTRQDDGQRARALLEGRGADIANTGTVSAEDTRYVVQVGAFGDAEKVREVRARLERSGLKTYTHAIDTKDGKRIRVRVGPFSSKAEADRAAARVKALDLPASVLSL